MSKYKYNFFSNIRKIIKLFKNNDVDYVFYSENSHYQKYYYSFILQIINDKQKIFYVSSDKKDIINLSNLNNVYIGKGILRIIFFLFLKTKFLFLTTTDLGNNILRKNDFIDNYVYIFHAAKSVHQGYTQSAFNNYDTIFCLGNYQNKEIEYIEKSYNLQKKNLINTGYFYFDFLLKNANVNADKDNILIAPSWNYSDENFLNKDCENLIDYLVKKNFNIIFRPHPEHYKRSNDILKKISKKFGEFSNFYFDKDKNNLKSMETSYILITDNSGIAIEYTFIFQQPVIYFDKYPKINNKEFKNINFNLAIEDEIKEKFGINYQKNDLENFDQIIEKTKKEFIIKKAGLASFIKLNFYNFGKSSEFADKYIKNILKK